MEKKTKTTSTGKEPTGKEEEKNIRLYMKCEIGDLSLSEVQVLTRQLMSLLSTEETDSLLSFSLNIKE